jgi:hypothetical protein
MGFTVTVKYAILGFRTHAIGTQIMAGGISGGFDRTFGACGLMNCGQHLLAVIAL